MAARKFTNMGSLLSDSWTSAQAESDTHSETGYSTPPTLVGSDSWISLQSDYEALKGESAIPVEELAIYPSEEPAPPRTLIDILEATVSAHPTALAIDDGSSRLTYTELLQKTQSKAAELREAGVSHGDRVGIHLSSGTLNLYVSILSVLYAGAAYVPINEDDTDERANTVWTEANVTAICTDDGIVTVRQNPVAGPEERPSIASDAWIIFTSGSTGKPKGVAVTHRSAAAFVDAEASVFLQEKPLGPGDRVLAGLSVAFDASCEETWLAWAYGACLVPAPRSIVKAGAELGTFLTTQRISVVSTVPTLASMWPAEALQGIRLLILGGEALPPGLADRLAQSVEEVWNTYGPTEATVVSCGSQVRSGQPVAIGLPLRGWKLAVVDSEGHAVRWGEEGELIIGGVGMARYLDMEKDKVKFTSQAAFSGERGYSSGDLVRAERRGLYFIGRNDDQIKYGGRRIELGEIDAALLKLRGVSAAACTIQRSELGSQVLVGYVVRDHGDSSQDRETLRALLHPSLVPMVACVGEIPMKSSGKVDRKALPWPLPVSASDSSSTIEGTAGIIAEQWRRVLGVKPSSADSNFFDLGGTSLGAAQLVSQLRGQVPSLSVADVYEYSTLDRLARRFDELAGHKQEQRQVRPTPRWTFLLQLPIVLLELLLEGLRLLAVVLLTKKTYSVRLPQDSWARQNDLPWWLVSVLWFLMVSMPGRVIVYTSIVRVLTIGIAPGTYPRGGVMHIRVWAAEHFVDIGRLGAITGTAWCRIYARILGCRVDSEVQLHTLPPTTGLASFGSGCAVEPESDVSGWWIDGDVLQIGSITIGDNARIGTRSFLMPDTVVEPRATVQPGLCVKDTVFALESRSPDTNSSLANSPSVGRRIWTFFRDTMTLLLMDFFPFITVVPGWGLAMALRPDLNDYRQLFMALLKVTLPGSALGILLSAGVTIVLVRLAAAAIVPGSHSWHSRAAWAAWLTRTIMLEARTSLFPIYASLLTPTWLRLLGAKIGRNVEISTVVPVPSLLRVADGAFLADDVLISPYELIAGQVKLGFTSIGEKSFIGNTGLVNAGVDVPEKVLVGVLATAPSQDRMSPGSTWLGRPPISLPRQAEEPANSKRTFDPPTRLIIARALVESCRILPLLITGMLSMAVFLGMLWFLIRFGVGYTILVSPALVLGAGLAACVVTTAAKWLLTPSIHAGQQSPLWSHFVWRNELADTFVQSLALPYLKLIFGTPILPFWLRTLGAKIGGGVWLESHLLPEAELITIGAGATVNRGCVLQTHLFHDRLMRMDTVCLQAGATLGPGTISLPATDIGAGVTVGPRSLVMRGERVPAGTSWLGNPVRLWDRQTLMRRKSMGQESQDSSEKYDTGGKEGV